jgi:hypothetical protein
MDNITQTIQSIYTYTCDVRRDNTLWINFNIRYNRRMKLNITEERLEPKELYRSSSNHPIQMTPVETDQNARYTFEKWIKKTFPHISYEPVLDLMPEEYISWPYLGSFAINVPVGSNEYKMIRHQYETIKGDHKNINACLYIMKYEDAIEKYNFDQSQKDVMTLWTKLCPN